MTPRIRRVVIMIALIAAGETVFLLPFVVARIFRPTYLDVFNINNLQLGTAFSLYGFVAMISYLLGGPLADRYSARKLISTALIATSFGGLIFAMIPSLAVLTVLYGFWGLTTILLFWAALLRATREWGGDSVQGTAYGLLDGGRGLFAALLASISVWVFAQLLPEQVSEATLEDRTTALKQIIWIFTGIIVMVAILIWMVIPESQNRLVPVSKRLGFNDVKVLIRKPKIQLQALIIICAYTGYKVTDDFSLYASDAFGYDDVAAARLGTISFWVRPVAAISAGILADRFSASKGIIISFLLMMIGSFTIGSGSLHQSSYWFLVMVIVSTSAGIYALRGLYFALFQEAKVPLSVTGSAIGLVSVAGFTPDIFMGPLMGFLIDRSPGALGHHHVFLVIGTFAFIGLIAAIFFRRLTRVKN